MSNRLKLGLVDPNWDLIDPTPNIHELFENFNNIFFDGKLQTVEVRWSSRMTSCAGVCCYEGNGGLCSVRLSAPLLKLRPRKDLVETLLHEMIHAYLFVTNNNRDRDGHGPEFQKHMNRINAEAGTNISIYHDFVAEVKSYQMHVWKCDGRCRDVHPYYGTVRRAMNRAPGPNDTWWARHQATCGGTFFKVSGGVAKKPKKDGAPKANKTAANNSTDIRKYLPPTSTVVSSDENKLPKSGSIPLFGGQGWKLGGLIPMGNRPPASPSPPKLRKPLVRVAPSATSTAAPSASFTVPSASFTVPSASSTVPSASSTITSGSYWKMVSGAAPANTAPRDTAADAEIRKQLIAKLQEVTIPVFRVDRHGRFDGGPGDRVNVPVPPRNSPTSTGDGAVTNDGFKGFSVSDMSVFRPRHPIEYVSCPICQQRVDNRLINEHLDAVCCAGTPAKRAALDADTFELRSSQSSGTSSCPSLGYLCYMCEREYISNDALVEHQKTCANSLFPVSESVPGTSDAEPELIKCPICGGDVNAKRINQHLDVCLSKEQPGPTG